MGLFNSFWSTVISIELMNLVFSIDNIFAVVDFSDNFLLICLGVFVEILPMFFVAHGFVKLMEKYPFLQTPPFLVILLSGLKVLFPLHERFLPDTRTDLFYE
ncbi:MAG: TerC family protein [Flavobacteriales bacterium AspAUS03]